MLQNMTSQHFASSKLFITLIALFDQADDDILLYNERYVEGELDFEFQELVEISQNEIRKGMQSLKCGTSSGPDLARRF